MSGMSNCCEHHTNGDKQETMQTARGNEHKLLAFFTMSDAAFAARGHGKDKWWDVLGVPKPAAGHD